MLERAWHRDRTEITFVRPADQPRGEVSVVGDFNGWEPGVHALVPRGDGFRAVTVAMPRRTRVGFRYLCEGGHWFDEAGADEYDGRNGYVFT